MVGRGIKTLQYADKESSHHKGHKDTEEPDNRHHGKLLQEV